MKFLCAVVLSALPLVGRATDLHEYKRGETLVIEHGLSPDKQFSISAGNSYKGEESTFHLFLADAKAKKRIGPLEEAHDPLDTGPESLHAAWAPDSRHVIITFRVDRHITEMVIYRIDNRRAYLVENPPDLVTAVKEAKNVDTSNEDAFFVEPKWSSASRFTLRQESQYNRLKIDPTRTLGAYAASVDRDDGEYSLDFAAEAVCEVAVGDKCQIVSVKPAKASPQQ